MERMKNKGILILSLLLILLPMAYAKPVFYETDEDALAVCQGEMITASYFIKNDGNSQKEYIIDLEGDNEEWISVAPDSLNLLPGESEEVFVFITPEIYADEGDYSFKLIAQDLEDAEERAIQEVKFNVKNCHKFSLSTEEELSGCVGEEIESSIYIKNEGKYLDNVKLEIMIDGTEKSESYTFAMKPEEKREVKVRFTPSEVKNYTISYSLTVEGLEQYKEEAETTFISKACPGVEISLEEMPGAICIGREYELIFKIKNTGTLEDIFTLSSDSISFSENKMKLSPDEEKEITGLIVPRVSSEKIVIKIESENGISEEKSFLINAESCCNISLISPPEEIKVCKGELSQIDLRFSIFNGGTPANYTIKSQDSWLYPQLSNIYLEQNDEEDFFARLRIPDEPGSYRTIITASSDKCEDKAHVSLKVEECYEFDAELDAPRTACGCSEEELALDLENEGGVGDSYIVSMIQPDFAIIGAFPLEAGQKTTIPIPLNTSCDESEENILIKVTSESNPSLTIVINETIELESCYGMEVNAPKELDFCAEEEREIELNIKNTGTKEDSLKITPLCPPWVEAEVEEIVLEPDETKTLKYKAKAPADIDKEAFCSFKIESTETGNINISSVILKVLPLEECYCFNIELDKEEVSFKNTNKTNQLVELIVTNCGRSDEKYLVEISGDLREYVDVAPSSIELKPGESEPFHIAISKPLEGESGDIEVSVSGENSRKKESLKLTIE
ncbi:MAG: hypothetical protein PWR30_5 [Candidatus Woesearchaeota archaeon]|nr:hypothetical protein [Candidatus Woesearchaeota archaeon]